MARRKKNKTWPERDMVLEYKGWKAGDRCYTVFSGETKPSLCDIKEFHPNDNVTPSVSVIEVNSGKHRVAAVMGIAEDAKGAKKLVPKLTKLLDTWRAEQARLHKAARIAEAKRQAAETKKLKEEAEAAEKEKAAADLEAEEEKTRKLKEKNNV